MASISLLCDCTNLSLFTVMHDYVYNFTVSVYKQRQRPRIILLATFYHYLLATKGLFSITRVVSLVMSALNIGRKEGSSMNSWGNICRIMHCTLWLLAPKVVEYSIWSTLWVVFTEHWMLVWSASWDLSQVYSSLPIPQLMAKSVSCVRTLQWSVARSPTVTGAAGLTTLLRFDSTV